ncbi:MAG: FHA domain-containing protein, partial [Acidobacteria bacterium]|nr:FHA domain-containing protein [Acidobacteriota bacterium]
KPLLIFDFTKNPMPRQICPELSAGMEAVLVRAVEYKPEHRFASAREMKQALVTHLAELEQTASELLREAEGTAFDALAPENEPAAGSHEHLGVEAVPNGPPVERVYCCHCGMSINGHDVFCAHCGGRQPTSLEWPRDSARLLVLDRETREIKGTFFLFKDSHLLGRTDANSGIFPEIDLSPFDPSSKVSRRHARIWRSSEEFFLEDLNSANGTLLNEAEAVSPKQARPLKDGDILRVGDTRLIFREGA